MDDVTAGRCQWPLEEPRHGAAVTVVITCVNRVQIQTSVTSQPVVVLLRPPDVSQVSLCLSVCLSVCLSFSLSLSLSERERGVRQTEISYICVWVLVRVCFVSVCI